MPDLDSLNRMSSGDAESALLLCCGSRAWARAMATARPFENEAALYAAADRIWFALGREEWLEAFSRHPRIGGIGARTGARIGSRIDETKASGWAAQEQGGVSGAASATLDALVRGNEAYEKRFGHVFLVCATGKSADEMLALLEARLGNDAARELEIAAGEQGKITRIRLQQWLKE